ncbi:uncharacterized protein LOC116293909 [Actinia tenebrosa]|uniref:Uncharacterized protein LOC116293909 n=1 Tax=Actinia tenebrosa TaxID=6105 RepID=A0A6P8HNL1_ACTTE|nr:uncharacterized protein LOC116293909 [Actinia tenebrosa]
MSTTFDTAENKDIKRTTDSSNGATTMQHDDRETGQGAKDLLTTCNPEPAEQLKELREKESNEIRNEPGNGMETLDSYAEIKYSDNDIEKSKRMHSNTVVSKEHDKTQPVKKERDRMQLVATRERNMTQAVRSSSVTHVDHVTESTRNFKPTTKTSLGDSSKATTTESVLPTSYKTKTGSVSYTPTKRPLKSLNSCNLPNLNPWDESIKHLLKDVGFDPRCSSRSESSFYDVIVNRLVLRNNSGTRPVVSLETIHREKNTDNSYYATKETLQMNASADGGYESKPILGSDFFRISYSLKGEYHRKTYYYARVVARQDVVQQSKMIRLKHNLKKGLPLNILMLGIDSTSNANFVRKMPHTLDWLKTEMRSYVLKGYSIVGDATTPALTALLTGERESTLPEGRIGVSGSKHIDEWPWISRLYEKHGYVTLYSEDDPEMSTFHLRLKGFSQPPFHHYMRPFWLAIEDEEMRDETGICSGGVSLVNYTMDYLVSFFEAYKETPKFAMGLLSYLTHAHPNQLSYGDLDVLSMLEKLKSRGNLNDTLLVIFGDHGSRNDDVRNTMQGKLEERLPWLSISVPDWLESEYPDLTAALANNEQIISSPFDVHTTLRHMLAYPEIPKAGSYHSLFTNLSRDRTCQDAGIDEHWCPCLQFTPDDTQRQSVIGSAQAVVDHINKRLTSSPRLKRACHVISLVRIHSVMKYEPNYKVQTFHSTNQKVYNSSPRYRTPTKDDLHYLITMETSPMGALFEATVAITHNDTVVVNPNISRINLYGDQPNCIARTHPYLKKFCVCKA